MSYAVRKDGKGWRAVNGASEVSVDETYSDTQPAPITPTTQELRAAELRALFEQWQSDLAALQFAWVAALREDGDSETDRKADIAAEIEELQIQYQSDVAAVKLKYNEV